MSEELKKQIVKIMLDTIDRIVERTENTWDNAAAIVVRKWAELWLGIKMGDGCPEECQAECDQMCTELEAAVAEQ